MISSEEKFCEGNLREYLTLTWVFKKAGLQQGIITQLKALKALIYSRANGIAALRWRFLGSIHYLCDTGVGRPFWVPVLSEIHITAPSLLP